MGRTKRLRLKKKLRSQSQPLDHDNSTVALKKFMSRNGFIDPINLKLRNFFQTGRGVVAGKALRENDTLIRIPYNLMITYTTVESLNYLQLFTPGSKLTMHDLLTVFLVMERRNVDSFWKEYINSLPEKTWLPALLPEECFTLLPFDLKIGVDKSRRAFEESWARLRKSMEDINILSYEEFTWAFVLVNTRAVYVDPKKILCQQKEILLDAPSIALCPFLDMFNHNDKASTRADLVLENHQLFYELTTLTQTNAFEQIFISYGAHDNTKLFSEYGFFIPNNIYDSIVYQSTEVLRVECPQLNPFQYRFIKKHNLDQEMSLYVNNLGPSFNVKALAFVAFEDYNEKKLSGVIYNENYSKSFLKSVYYLCQKLCKQELISVRHFLRTLTELNTVVYNQGVDLLLNFLMYKQQIMDTFCKKCVTYPE